MKSIMQKEKECYLCRLEAGKQGYYGELPHAGLHRHHVIYGKGNRKKSEQYGLWVYLCAARHHEYGPEAVHNNRKNRILLCRAAQEAFEMKYPRSLFLQEFGINYLDDTKSEKKEEHNEKNRQQETIEDGFIRLEINLEDLPF